MDNFEDGFQESNFDKSPEQKFKSLKLKTHEMLNYQSNNKAGILDSNESNRIRNPQYSAIDSNTNFGNVNFYNGAAETAAVSNEMLESNSRGL